MNMGREERVIIVEPLASPACADQTGKHVDRRDEEVATSWIPAPSDPAWTMVTVSGDGPSEGPG